MIFNKKKYKTAIALTVAIGFLNPFQLGLAQQSSGNQELVKAVKAVSATIKASVLTRMAEDYYIPKVTVYIYFQYHFFRFVIDFFPHIGHQRYLCKLLVLCLNLISYLKHFEVFFL